MLGSHVQDPSGSVRGILKLDCSETRRRKCSDRDWIAEAARLRSVSSISTGSDVEHRRRGVDVKALTSVAPYVALEAKHLDSEVKLERKLADSITSIAEAFDKGHRNIELGSRAPVEEQDILDALVLISKARVTLGL